VIVREPRTVEALVRAHAANPWPYPPEVDSEPAPESPDASSWLPEVILCFDTETTIDATQRLNFGVASVYRVRGAGTTIRLLQRKTWILHDDFDLAERDPAGLDCLRAYVRTEMAWGADDRRASPNIELLPRHAFVRDVLYRVGAWAHAAIVAANLPFDLSRIGAPHLEISKDQWEARTGNEIDPATGKRRKRTRPDFTDGGFSIPLMERHLAGRWEETKSYPRVKVKKIGRGKAFIAWGKSDKLLCRAKFIDALTLAGALSGKSQSLQSACGEFGSPYTKRDVTHGRITIENVLYCREDEHATARLLERLLREHAALGIAQDPSRLYSGASITTDVLDRLGVPRYTNRGLNRRAIGAAAASYFGGRAECVIRRVAVPVVHTDVTAEYPAVSALLDLQRLLVADRVVARDGEPEEIEQFLSTLTIEQALDPATWQDLAWFALVEPAGDLLPVRTRWAANAGIGQALVRSSVKPLWYAGPDLVGSALRVGWRGKIRTVLRLEPEDPVASLRALTLGTRQIDLRAGDDLYVALVEERERHEHDWSIPQAQRKRWRRFFKLVVNALYGKAAEANPTDPPSRGQKVRVEVDSDELFAARVNRPEIPGPFNFMPVASLTTAGGRLLLAIIERLVTDRLGSWGLADTDSFAIVATREGGWFPCPGGHWWRVEDGTRTIHALSWDEVQEVTELVNALNPFSHDLLPQLLDCEDVNFEDGDRSKQRQLYYFGVGAKRYTFLTRSGEPTAPVAWQEIREVVSPSKFAIGTYADPAAVKGEERWSRSADEAWWWILGRELGARPDTPSWFGHPAVHEYNVASPRLLSTFGQANKGLPYARSIKPFSFLLTAELSPDDQERLGDLRLAAPFRMLPKEWAEMPWRNTKEGPHQGAVYRLVPEDTAPTSLTAIDVHCRSYRQIVSASSRARESKADEALGQPSDRDSIGLLIPPIVDVACVSHAGKDMNDLDEVEAGVRSPDETLLAYPAGERTAEREAVATLGIGRVSKASSMPATTVQGFADGRGTGPALVDRILQGAMKLIRADLDAWREPPPRGDVHGIALCYLVAWQRNVGRVAVWYPEAMWALGELSRGAAGWVAERAWVDPSNLRSASDAETRADVTEAVSAAIACLVPLAVLARWARLPAGRRELVQARQKKEEAPLLLRLRTELPRARTQYEADQIRGELSRAFGEMHDRHYAEASRVAVFDIPGLYPVEEIHLRGLRAMISSSAPGLCPFCGRSMRLGDRMCGSATCRGLARRSTRVKSAPLGTDARPKRGRPSLARFEVAVSPDHGWSAVKFRYGISPFELDPLPDRTDECHKGSHAECPGGHDGVTGEAANEQGLAVSVSGWVRCPCRCHRPTRRP
jgi:hypothetical protein